MKSVPVTTRALRRFWAKVDKSGDCWVWTGGRNAAGYGRFYFEGLSLYAHRFSFSLAFGKVPDGKDVDHACRNRACVNPSHLSAVSHKANLENQSGAHAGSTSSIRGVSWNKEKRRWVAQVTHNGKSRFLGRFSSEQEAGRVAEKARNELFTNNLLDRTV